jgi:hypothetical protein
LVFIGDQKTNIELILPEVCEATTNFSNFEPGTVSFVTLGQKDELADLFGYIYRQAKTSFSIIAGNKVKSQPLSQTVETNNLKGNEESPFKGSAQMTGFSENSDPNSFAFAI